MTMSFEVLWWLNAWDELKYSVYNTNNNDEKSKHDSNGIAPLCYQDTNQDIDCK